MNCRMMGRLAWALLAFTLISTPSFAGTFFSSNSSLNVQLVGADDVTGTSLGSLPDGVVVQYVGFQADFVLTDGTGFGSAQSGVMLNGLALTANSEGLFLSPIKVGDNVTESISVAGGTLADTDFALAVSGFLSVFAATNLTDQAITLNFGVTLNYQILSEVDDPNSEFAYSMELVQNSGLSLLDFVEFNGDHADSLSGFFSLTVNPGETATADLLHAAGGDPFVRYLTGEGSGQQIPEPASFLLCGGLALVLGGAHFARQRRVK
ncbi:MAG: hypothetical protein JSS02_11245 [Planctomycetes bacterium]|nr:hypothetical protein [Planctomycetota bacterium]